MFIHTLKSMTTYTPSHVKNPVVHVRVWWITETGKDPACTCRAGCSAALAAAVALIRLRQPEFPTLDYVMKCVFCCVFSVCASVALCTACTKPPVWPSMIAKS